MDMLVRVEVVMEDEGPVAVEESSSSMELELELELELMGLQKTSAGELGTQPWERGEVTHAETADVATLTLVGVEERP